MFTFIRSLKSRRGLNRLGYRQSRDFLVPDGLGGHFKVNRLVLGQHGISVILYMPYEGNIFCAEKIEEWTQMINGKSFTFENPLAHLDIIINTITEMVDVPVDGYLYFEHHACFPKGKPERVLNFESLPDALLPAKRSKPDKQVAKAWDELVKK